MQRAKYIYKLSIKIPVWGPNGESYNWIIAARRRRSSLLPVLNRLASLGLSVNSQTDLTKASFEPPTPHDSDDDLDSSYVPSISRMSSVSLDDFNLGRTVSNSTVSTLPVLTPKPSVNSYAGEDNPVFDDSREFEVIICWCSIGHFWSGIRNYLFVYQL